jgi:hypothetical protein
VSRDGLLVLVTAIVGAGGAVFVVDALLHAAAGRWWQAGLVAGGALPVLLVGRHALWRGIVGGVFGDPP